MIRESRTRQAFEAYCREKFPEGVGRVGVYQLGKAFEAGADFALSESKPAWVPVSERLPTGGQFVLAFVKDGNNTRRIRAFYAEKGAVESGTDDEWCEYDEVKDEYFLPAGWYEANEYEETHWHVSDGTVTHWMPLPDAPSERTREHVVKPAPEPGRDPRALICLARMGCADEKSPLGKCPPGTCRRA